MRRFASTAVEPFHSKFAARSHLIVTDVSMRLAPDMQQINILHEQQIQLLHQP
jgi:hypothetical protein